MLGRKFRCNMSESTDSGEIAVIWTEEIFWRSEKMLMNSIISTLMLVFIGIIIASFLYFSFTFMPEEALIFSNIVFMPLFAIVATYIPLFLMRIFGRAPIRSLVFRPDRQILLPQGMPRKKSTKRLDITRDDVANFEIGPSRSFWGADMGVGVQIITHQGTTINISRRLQSEEAREVVVKLSQALRMSKAGIQRQ